MKEEEVERVIEMMEDLSICKVESREVSGREMAGIRIHDLIHDYCVARSEKYEGVRRWHEKMIEGYKSRYGVYGGSDGQVGWWSEEVADDSYIHANLTRHLVESGKADELEMLMFDYRWTTRQLTMNRYLGLESDFRELVRSRTQQRKRGEEQ